REAGGGTGDAQRRGGHSGGTAPAGEHVADRAGLAVGDHEALPVHGLDPVEGGDDRVGGVGDVGGVDQRHAVVQQREPAATGAVDDPAHQLGVAGAPHDVGADRGDAEVALAVGAHRQQLGRRLGAGV